MVYIFLHRVQSYPCSTLTHMVVGVSFFHTTVQDPLAVLLHNCARQLTLGGAQSFALFSMLPSNKPKPNI